MLEKEEEETNAKGKRKKRKRKKRRTIKSRRRIDNKRKGVVGLVLEAFESYFFQKKEVEVVVS